MAATPGATRPFQRSFGEWISSRSTLPTPGSFYAATHHQGVFKSHNRGRSWLPMNRGLEPQRRTPSYGAYLVDGVAFAPRGFRNHLRRAATIRTGRQLMAAYVWHELDRTLTCEFARSFAISPADPRADLCGHQCRCLQIHRRRPDLVVRQPRSADSRDCGFDCGRVSPIKGTNTRWSVAVPPSSDGH